MRNQPYNIQFTDGTVIRIEFATSSGEAIYQALWSNRGKMVKRCYQGFDSQDKRYPGGGIEYTVPDHASIANESVQPKRTRTKDTTLMLRLHGDISN